MEKREANIVFDALFLPTNLKILSELLKEDCFVGTTMAFKHKNITIYLNIICVFPSNAIVLQSPPERPYLHTSILHFIPIDFPQEKISWLKKIQSRSTLQDLSTINYNELMQALPLTTSPLLSRCNLRPDTHQSRHAPYLF
jgi:hypothetical protein